MASLYIQEYEDLATDSKGNVILVGKEPAITSQKVTYTTSTQSTAFNGKTRFIRVIADADAHLAFSASPTATANSMLLKANTVEYFGVNPGDEVAAYDGSS